MYICQYIILLLPLLKLSCLHTSYNLLNDLVLIEKIRVSDDHAAFAEIYNRFADELFVVAFRKTKDKDIAEEVVQITFVKFWKNRAHLNIRGSVKAFIYTSLKNNIVTHFSGKLAKSTLSLDYFSDEQMPPANTTQEAIDYNYLIKVYEDSLKELPEKCKEVFVLSRNGYSMKEIARIQNISPKTVEVHIGKALRFLRAKLNTFFLLLLLLK